MRNTNTHSKQPNTHRDTHISGEQDNGVCQCGESAAPGVEENHPAEEVILGEDDVQERLGERRGVRVGHCSKGIGNSFLVSGTSRRNGGKRRNTG